MASITTASSSPDPREKHSMNRWWLFCCFSLLAVVVIVGFACSLLPLTFCMVESHMVLGQELCCCRASASPAPVTSVLHGQQMCNYSTFIFSSSCPRDATFSCLCTFLLWCWALRATSLRKEKRFIGQYIVFFRTYWYLLTDIHIIFMENCYGAPWGNAAVACGLIDGVR